MTDIIHLLYTEDNFQDADLTRVHFETAATDFQIEIVGTGAACLARLAEQSFDVLLLDNRLPDMDGLDVLGKLRANGHTLPVVMVTGMGDEETVAKSLRAGAADYVSKSEPDYLIMLPELLRQVVARQSRLSHGNDGEQRNQKILYIEPNAMDVELTEQHFASAAPHLQLHPVTSSHDALTLLTGKHDFDLVLTDLRVPDMNALELLRETLHRGIELPFVVITGRGDEATAVAILRLGAYDYLVKRKDYLIQLPHSIDHALHRFDLDQTADRLNSELTELTASLEDKVASRTTDLVNANTALSESLQHFQMVFDHVPVGNIETDENGQILSFNFAAQEMFGYSADEAIGQDVKMLLLDPVASQHDQYIQNFRETSVSKITRSGREVIGLRKNGEEFPMHLGVGEMKIGDKRTFINSAADLTEVKALEENLRHAQRMEAVGQLTGGIAHDFNNILGIILGYLELIQGKVSGDETTSAYTNSALKGVHRAADITRKLLNFSREEVGEEKLTSINEFVEGMKELIAKSLTVSINTSTHLTENIWLVKINPGDLEDTLLNLALNARDAMPSGGALMIETSNKVLDESYVQQNPQGRVGEFVMLSVSDSGQGMNPKVRDKVLEPFFTTKEKGKGTGLGLSMVYGFVQRSGGHIKIYSEVGEGTTIQIYLPRARIEDEVEVTV